MNEQELLASLQRGNWRVIARHPHTTKVQERDANNNPVTVDKPDGNVSWTIQGPNGEFDEVVVTPRVANQPSAATIGQSTGGEIDQGGPASSGPNYTYAVVEPPKKPLPKATTDKPVWTNIRNVGTEVWGTDPADNVFKKLPGVPPNQQPGTRPASITQDGVTYILKADGSGYEPAPGIPAPPAKAEAPIFKEYEGKLYQWVPDPSKPGGGTLKLAEGIGEGAHPPGYFIEGGYKVYKNWNEGTKKYEVDASVQPEAWSPEAQAAAAKTAGQPKEGDTRPNISGGYKVTQTYKGGEWTTTEIGERATPRDIQTLTPSTEAPYIVQTDAQGQPVSVPNPNYQGPKAPTTRGELAQRVALLRTQAAQMRDKIAADASIPKDQQLARFNQWYDQNVTPQAGALEQQQQAVMADEAQKAIEAQQKNLTAAANAMQSVAPYRVGPNYAQSFEQGLNRLANTQFPGMKAQTPLDFTGSVGWKGPSLDQSVQEVLAARQPVQPGMDLQSMLNRNQWVPGGPVPAPGAPTPGGPPPPTPEQLAAQAAAGQQTAAASANPANSPLGAVGPNPLLVAIQARNRQLASQQTAAATAQASPPFGALNSMPRAGAMPMASGSGPLPYNPGAFSGVMPLLPGYDYSQFQGQWQPPY